VTVVLLHAFPLDERMWAPQLDFVPDALTPRLYGRGATMDAWAESVAAEADGDLVLVGASMGGYCALALARRAPERVSALLLAGSRPDADSDERRAGRTKTIELIRAGGPDALWRDMVPKLFADPADADESLLFREADGLIGAVAAIRDRADSSDVARSLRERVRFVVGEHDPFVSPEELQGYDVRTIAGSGHLPNLERADDFNAQLGDLLAHA
jgi:pimeloyl-ACP methyl ester carboxylesterase